MNSSLRFLCCKVDPATPEFTSFGKVNDLVPALVIDSGMLSVTSTLSVRIGSGRSSPSPMPAALAVMRTLATSIPAGTVIAQPAFALWPGAAVNERVVFSFVNDAVMSLFVVGSKSVS